MSEGSESSHPSGGSVRNKVLKVNRPTEESQMCRHGGHFQHALPRKPFLMFLIILGTAVSPCRSCTCDGHSSSKRIPDAPKCSAALLGNTQQ